MKTGNGISPFNFNPMKKISIIILGILLFASSCKKFLNEPPLDRITDADVWRDKALMDTYLYKIYDNMPWCYLSDFGGAGDAYRFALSDEARSTYDWNAATNTFRPGNWGTNINWWPMGWWGYSNIYKINYAYENISKVAGNVMNETERNNRMGELLYMRAFAYFELAKRYGGVPIILKPQDPTTTPQDELYPKRNKEKEVYDQILADLERAFVLLPETWGALDGRATKWAAKALESRAALYAGSIAKYGKLDLDGVVGIPAADADSYYNRSLTASKLIISSGPFHLFNKYPDAAKNYYQLFVDETLEETIFRKIYIPYEKGHEWDLKNVPYSYRVDWGSSLSPTKQMVDSYEVLSTGLLPGEVGSGFDPANPYQNRDPRLAATIITNNSLFQGSNVQIWYGTERNGTIDTKTGTGVGKDGMGIHPDATKTGYYIRKYLMDGSSPLFTQRWYSGQDCIIFRLGEIYMNAAEAAVETNRDAEARTFVKPIRVRAGLQQNLDFASYSGEALRDRIRNERKIELAFEDHRYWDVRRWRIAVEKLSIQVLGDRPLRHIDALGNVTFTYETINAEASKMGFYERQYYLPIGRDNINNNNKLVENPGY